MMKSAVWKKLNLKEESQIAVLNAPESFEDEINKKMKRNPKRALTKMGRTKTQKQ